MSMRRSLSLAAGAAILALPLSACGFNYATDELYNASVGVDNRDGAVDVLSAVIVSSGTDGEGKFIASFSNNSDETTDHVIAVIGSGESAMLHTTKFTPIEILPRGFVSLSTEGGVPVTGSFKPGEFVTVTVQFSNAEPATLSVPVVNATGPYTGLG